jgi:hypothetical protein
MARIGVLAALALALGACRDGDQAAAKAGGGQESAAVAVTGVVASADENRVEVTTDDGRRLALRMTPNVSVTLAGGQAEAAVITEGAPVRVSYRPQGSGGELVAVDVEPQAATAPGGTKDAPPDPPADPSRAQPPGR